MPVTPQVPNKAGLVHVGPTAKPQETTQPAKPVPIPVNQPSSLGYLVPPSSPVLPYVASPNLEAAPSAPNPSYAAPPSAALISSVLVAPPGVAAVPVVAQPPAIIMPPGLKPPPENRLPSLAFSGGVRRLQIPERQQNPYQHRPTNYQPDYATYYGGYNAAADRRQSSHGYQTSSYSNSPPQWGSNRYYPASSYEKMGIPSKNSYQRTYRQTAEAVKDQGKFKLT